MTRNEYNEFRYIRKVCRENDKAFGLGYGSQLTIRTNASVEYKTKLHELYTSYGFHPASVRVDARMFDENERIVYIFGNSFDMNGEAHPWQELYTASELEAFAAAIGIEYADLAGITSEPMTAFYIEPGEAFEKWMHQNEAEYTGDYVEGVLLDSFVVQTKRGTAAVYESFVNPNASRYYIEFQAGYRARRVWSNWYKFEASANADSLTA